MIHLFKKLFNIIPHSRLNSVGCIGLNVRSKAFVTYLNKCVGLPLGKKDSINIPNTILNSGLENSLACIKGIFDTDFSLTFKRKNKKFHSYPIIELKANSENLIKSINLILNSVGIYSFLMVRQTQDIRFKKDVLQNILTISGNNNLKKWFKLIGSKNPSYLSRYAVYKKFGFCPPYTNYLERKKILLGQIDPRLFYGQDET
jgi:hypothetical protein